MKDKITVGNLGEKFAAEILKNQGYEIVGRNYRTKFGEIDIIAKKEECLHFIEVKTRSQDIYGRPCDAVTNNKIEKIKNVAQDYMFKSKMSWKKISLDVFELNFNYIENCI